MEKNIFGLVKKFLRVARVHKKLARVGSGWPKWPRVGSNFGSGFDPTHPYLLKSDSSIPLNFPPFICFMLY